jgi:pimeloyl-ACP methyl ester carboxylesterase
MDLYCIPGLGADHRVFSKLRVPPAWNLIPLPWVAPFSGESLESYALRLSAPMDNRRPFALLGLSFGGMVAGEIARRIPPERLVLISSIHDSTQLPPYYRWAGKIGIPAMVGPGLIRRASLLKRSISSESGPDKDLLRSIIRASDPDFIRWAMAAVLKWKGRGLLSDYIHIHGTRDRVLPMRYTRPTHVIRGAGHLLVLERSDTLNQILSEYL